jgi:hypothetical protein
LRENKVGFRRIDCGGRILIEKKKKGWRILRVEKEKERDDVGAGKEKKIHGMEKEKEDLDSE